MRSTFEEIEKAAARRVYRVSIAPEAVAARVAERLNQLGSTVKLPGFRPGHIPPAVLEQRYGAKARKEAIQALGAEAADSVRAQGELAASLDPQGELEFRLEVTHLAELPDLDFDAIEIERHSALLDDDTRQQVLDHLDQAYRFTVAPQLIAREYALIRRAAEQALASDPATQAMEAELRIIAERRVRLGAVVAEMATRYETIPMEEEVRKEQIAGETPAQTRDRLREDKLIALIISRARALS